MYYFEFRTILPTLKRAYNSRSSVHHSVVLKKESRSFTAYVQYTCTATADAPSTVYAHSRGIFANPGNSPQVHPAHPCT